MLYHLYATEKYSSSSITWSSSLDCFWIYIFADILVSLDNYISRSTAHFLTCKDPDYQQSLWNMISSVSGILTLQFGPARVRQIKICNTALNFWTGHGRWEFGGWDHWASTKAYPSSIPEQQGTGRSLGWAIYQNNNRASSSSWETISEVPLDPSGNTIHLNRGISKWGPALTC